LAPFAGDFLVVDEPDEDCFSLTTDNFSKVQNFTEFLNHYLWNSDIGNEFEIISGPVFDFNGNNGFRLSEFHIFFCLVSYCECDFFMGRKFGDSFGSNVETKVSGSFLIKTQINGDLAYICDFEDFFLLRINYNVSKIATKSIQNYFFIKFGFYLLIALAYSLSCHVHVDCLQVG